VSEADLEWNEGGPPLLNCGGVNQTCVKGVKTFAPFLVEKFGKKKEFLLKMVGGKNIATPPFGSGLRVLQKSGPIDII